MTDNYYTLHIMKELTLIILSIVLLLGCRQTLKPSQENKTEPKQSLWTPEQKENFIKKHRTCVMDEIVLQELIDLYEFEKNDETLYAYIGLSNWASSVTVESIQERIKIDIDDIAGKKFDEVEYLLGKYRTCRQINPLTGPYNLYTYSNGLIEIVYINGIADWITIFGEPHRAIINDPSKHLSVQHFSDYSYIIHKTKPIW